MAVVYFFGIILARYKITVPAKHIDPNSVCGIHFIFRHLFLFISLSFALQLSHCLCPLFGPLLLPPVLPCVFIALIFMVACFCCSLFRSWSVSYCFCCLCGCYFVASCFYYICCCVFVATGVTVDCFCFTLLRMPQSNKANWFSSNNFHFKSSWQIPAHFRGLLLFFFVFHRWEVSLLAGMWALSKSGFIFPLKTLPKVLAEICSRLPESGNCQVASGICNCFSLRLSLYI